MIMRNMKLLLAAGVLTLLVSAELKAQLLALPGWQAQLGNNSSTQVAGTVTIVDQFTLLFEDFSYNGTGGGETDIVLVPFGDTFFDAPLSAQDRFSALGDFFFNDTPGSVTLVDDIRDINPDPGLPPEGGDSPPIFDADFTITVGRENFEAGAAGDAAFADFVANNGVLGFDTISVYCHPFDFDFGSGVFLPPLAPDADLNDDGIISGNDFLTLQENFGTIANSGNGFDVPGDTNRDSVVNSTDLNTLLQQFGDNVPIPPNPGSFDEEFPNFFDGRTGGLLAPAIGVPEPSTALLLALATPMLLRRRRIV